MDEDIPAPDREAERRALQPYDDELSGDSQMRHAMATHELVQRCADHGAPPTWSALLAALGVLLTCAVLTVLGLRFHVVVLLVAGLLVFPFVMCPLDHHRRRAPRGGRRSSPGNCR